MIVWLSVGGVGAECSGAAWRFRSSSGAGLATGERVVVGRSCWWHGGAGGWTCYTKESMGVRVGIGQGHSEKRAECLKIISVRLGRVGRALVCECLENLEGD